MKCKKIGKLAVVAFLSVLIAVRFVPSASAAQSSNVPLVINGEFRPRATVLMRSAVSPMIVQVREITEYDEDTLFIPLELTLPSSFTKPLGNPPSYTFQHGVTFSLSLTCTYVVGKGKGLGLNWFVGYANNTMPGLLMLSTATTNFSYSVVQPSRTEDISSQFLMYSDGSLWGTSEKRPGQGYFSEWRCPLDEPLNPADTVLYIQTTVEYLITCLGTIDIFYSAGGVPTLPQMTLIVKRPFVSGGIWDTGWGIRPEYRPDIGDSLGAVVDAINANGQTIPTRAMDPNDGEGPPVDFVVPDNPIPDLDLQPFWAGFFGTRFGQTVMSVVGIAVAIGLLGYLARRKTS